MSWACESSVTSVANDTYQFTSATFSAAIQTFLTAQCALLTPDQWPPNRDNEILEDPEFDFVVVGAGSAGAVLANRLTENSNWTVLLVEAGGLPTLGTEVPALYGGTVNTSLDWGYQTESQKNACLGYVDYRCYWPRGKVLGGSSSTNGMYYIRGNVRDFNEWEALGNSGWNYVSVLPYFKKSEDCDGSTLTEEELETYHGVGGYLHTENIGTSSFEQAILAANVENGITKVSDINGASQMGTTVTFSTTKGGRRQSTAFSFLAPIKDRSNLYVMTDAMATQILFAEDDATVVTGIKIKKGGELITINVKKEVIISAGTINSPQLLLLSGIGPENDLNGLGIEIKKNLSVGLNLQDHVYSPIFFTKPSTVSGTIGQYSQLIYDYVTKREGALNSTVGGRVVTFLNIKNSSSDFPDIQYHHVIYQPNYTYSSNYFKKRSFTEEVQSLFRDINYFNQVVQVSVVLLSPDSRGTVKLKSDDPFEHPLIDANYFNKSGDMETMIAGMKRAIKLAETATFKQQGYELKWLDIASCAGLDRTSDEFFECWAREMTFTTYHITGTNKMGPETDPDAVVDSECKVHGIEGLRVMDASIMPKVWRGNTNAVAIMIGEKGSDLIKSTWSEQ